MVNEMNSTAKPQIVRARGVIPVALDDGVKVLFMQIPSFIIRLITPNVLVGTGAQKNLVEKA